MRHPGGHLSLTREFWFKAIEDLYVRTRQAFFPCHQACPEHFCETGDTEQVLFLPYEAEYIQGKLGLGENPFEAVSLEGRCYGFLSGHRDCPYIRLPDCLIHSLRPFDCRSFPILPRFAPGHSVAFHRSPYCPLAPTLEASFVQLFTSCWRDLAPRLPEAWKDYYNAHCSGRSSKAAKR